MKSPKVTKDRYVFIYLFANISSVAQHWLSASGRDKHVIFPHTALQDWQILMETHLPPVHPIVPAVEWEAYPGGQKPGMFLLGL